MNEEKKEKKTEWLGWLIVYVLVGVGLLSLFVWWSKLPPELPWLYSLPWGEEQLIEKGTMAGVMAGLAGMLVLSNLLSKWMKKTDEGAGKIVRRISSVLVVLFLLGWYRVLSLVLVL